MALPLSAADEKHYTELIDGILATVDLETVTRKKIRMALESALGGKDLSDQKDAIKELIEQRFDAVSSSTPVAAPAQPSSASPAPVVKKEVNGHARYDEDEADADEIRVQPPKKKVRKEKSEDTEDADAKLAALLQAQENQRPRATRGGGSKTKTTNKKATPRKKSAKKVKPEDDSDLEDEGRETKKRKAGGGFQKPFNLSENLAALCGESQLPRPQVVKKLWDHIKGNGLQDPNDKRQILCDEAMRAVFRQPKVDMFQMNKMIGSHLYPVEEE